MGVDVSNGKISDMRDLHVWEPMANKISQIMMASEVANSILKIDEIHHFG